MWLPDDLIRSCIKIFAISHIKPELARILYKKALEISL